MLELILFSKNSEHVMISMPDSDVLQAMQLGSQPMLNEYPIQDLLKFKYSVKRFLKFFLMIQNFAIWNNFKTAKV